MSGVRHVSVNWRAVGMDIARMDVKVRSLVATSRLMLCGSGVAW